MKWVAILRRNAKQIAWLKIERCVLVQSRQENGRVGHACIPSPLYQEIGQIIARLAVYRALDIIQRLT